MADAWALSRYSFFSLIFFSLPLLYTYLPTISGPSVSLPILEKWGIYYNSTRVSCDYGTVVDGSDSTIMLKPVELSLFYLTAKNLTPVFERLFFLDLQESSNVYFLLLLLFVKALYFSVLTTIYFLKTMNEFYKNNALVCEAQSIQFQAFSKLSKLYSLKIHTSAFHNKCEMLLKFLGSWSICCPQATSICTLPQWAQIALHGLIQFQRQIIRFRHNWENIGENFKSSFQHTQAQLP